MRGCVGYFAALPSKYLWQLCAQMHEMLVMLLLLLLLLLLLDWFPTARK
eukprot:COSAG01_NODE_66310_length_270_cov_1.204678_1_plen_48_part_10